MCQNIQSFVSNIFKNVILLNTTFYLEKNGDPDIKIARKKFALRKDVFPCIFPLYVLTCHLQLPLYDAPSHQNVANEMRNTMKLCKNNNLTLTKLLHINYFLKDYVVVVA